MSASYYGEQGTRPLRWRPVLNGNRGICKGTKAKKLTGLRLHGEESDKRVFSLWLAGELKAWWLMEG